MNLMNIVFILSERGYKQNFEIDLNKFCYCDYIYQPWLDLVWLLSRVLITRCLSGQSSSIGCNMTRRTRGRLLIFMLLFNNHNIDIHHHTIHGSPLSQYNSLRGILSACSFSQHGIIFKDESQDHLLYLVLMWVFILLTRASQLASVWKHKYLFLPAVFLVGNSLSVHNIYP